MHSNSEILSINEILKWMRAKFWGKGAWDMNKNKGGELPFAGFCRAIKIDRRDVSDIIHGKRHLPASRRGAVSRFIRDWENGLLAFSKEKYIKGAPGRRGVAGKTPREVVHLSEPRRMPTRVRVDLTNGPKIKWMGRPAPAHRMPEFKDAFELIRKN